MSSSVFDFWVHIKGYDGYMVNPSGDIRSVNRLVARSDTGTLVLYSGVLMVKSITHCGYENVRVSIGNTKKNISVHRAVAKAFIPEIEFKNQVNHKDGDKTNNHMLNLEWVDNSENQIHSIDNGLQVHSFGSGARRFTGSVDAYRDGVFVCRMSGNAEMKQNGFDYRLVSAVIKGKRKKHKGCTFIKNDV